MGSPQCEAMRPVKSPEPHCVHAQIKLDLNQCASFFKAERTPFSEEDWVGELFHLLFCPLFFLKSSQASPVD